MFLEVRSNGLYSIDSVEMMEEHILVDFLSGNKLKNSVLMVSSKLEACGSN